MKHLIIFIFAFCVVAYLLFFFILKSKNEGFLSGGDYPISVNGGLLDDSYKAIGKNEVSSNTYSDNAKLQHSNPDNGKCTPAEFCNTMYASEINKNVNKKRDGVGARVGLYRTDDNYFAYSTPGNDNILL
jgi:hypothetical protein